MKQIIQDLRRGHTQLVDVPVPAVLPGHVLIQTTRTLVSLGTERMLVDFGKANLIQKARQQPEKVKMVLDKIKAEGLRPTLETVFNKLDEPLPLGYCNVGVVREVGDGVSEFQVGDRVASNGQHAEYVCVPQNLVTRVPDQVTDEEAAFTVIGAIGLQGIRLLDPKFGETVVVIGLGLIGLITAELLIANGCRVIGIDLDEAKLALAKVKGVIPVAAGGVGNVVDQVLAQTGGVGADGVVITASAKTNEIVSQAARMSRKRGSIILVGVVGLELNRAEFYEKELRFQVSCSYGPGRYDPEYEEKGKDYPIGFVRWTEKRNFDAVLQAMASGKLDVRPLISEVVPLESYHEIYGSMGKSSTIASLLKYSSNGEAARNIMLSKLEAGPKEVVFGIVGAGNFTKVTMLPALQKAGANIKYICSAKGLNATNMAKKYGIANSTTDYNQILQDTDVNTVIITTRHNLHAPMVIDALKSGKAVFVEKPLALNAQELDQILEAYSERPQPIAVGFNRRFSPHMQKIKTLLPEGAPKNFNFTMNAGFIPADFWVHDIAVGGGRIIGEACHLIDLMTFLSGSMVQEVCMSSLGVQPSAQTDNASILLKYRNGDHGVINYFANGSKAYSKERFEVFFQNQTLICDNFRETRGYGTKGFNKLKTRLDKGHAAQFDLLASGHGQPLIPFDEIINTTKASFAALDSLQEGRWITIN